MVSPFEPISISITLICILQLIPVTPTALVQRAGLPLKDCTCVAASVLQTVYLTDGYGALVQKWTSILQAVYGGATLAISRKSTVVVLVRVPGL